jgi:hypothetical protein
MEDASGAGSADCCHTAFFITVVSARAAVLKITEVAARNAQM